MDAYRARQGRFRLVDVPELQYLAVDGTGDPNTPPFAEALAAIYPVAYTLKRLSARELRRDYVVPPLEALWWADDMDAFTARRDKTRWRWTAMLLVPDWLDHDAFETAAARVAAKRRPSRLEDVRLECLAEGRCVQTLHVGSFDDETDVLHRLHDEIVPAHGLRLTGRHHEIYLSDARRVPPDRRRTILRQPVEEDGPSSPAPRYLT